MLRLSEPSYTFTKSLEDCAEGMANYTPLKGKIATGKAALLAAGDIYSTVGRAGELHSIRPFSGEPEDEVIAGLTKADLVKVYEQYFVPQEKTARKIYDSIMNAANEKCPFCGGIGTPRNLDHFLPKAFFPQYAFMPLNLVPACRDCNMDGKASAVITSAEEQPIQPYLDDSKFFGEQWIFATYHAAADGSPGQCRYFANPPMSWSATDRRRATHHFETFDLANRYSVKAAEHLVTVLTQVNNLKRFGLSDADVRSTLLQPGADFAPFVNHWQRSMYQALM